MVVQTGFRCMGGNCVSYLKFAATRALLFDWIGCGVRVWYDISGCSTDAVAC